ncbi:hypothetical protein BC833DRAFT_293411 [Globomyces pollinis-pini]|nr:hypothetical protein BC833DRAFT_293411 [Globomyces pollinis-pini]
MIIICYIVPALICMSIRNYNSHCNGTHCQLVIFFQSMSFLKTQLKAARDAINSKSYEYAQELCETILENDSSNYNACVFLGVAYQEQELFTKAIGIYEKAISISPTQPLAYQGLLKLYEKTRSVQDIDQEGHFKTLDRVANLYIKSIWAF